LRVTDPLGVRPGPEVTVTLKATGDPAVEGFEELETVLLLAALATDSVRAAEVLPEYVLSPLYTPVIA
jgi:hypothetical protein